MAKHEVEKAVWVLLLCVLGVANIVFGLLAVKDTAQVIFWFASQRRGSTISTVFYGMILANCCFALSLVWAGIRLLRMQARGISLSIALLSAELVYFVSVFLAVKHFPEPLLVGQPALTDIANVGLALQMHFRYPFFALFLLGIAYWQVPRRFLEQGSDPRGAGPALRSL